MVSSKQNPEKLHELTTQLESYSKQLELHKLSIDLAIDDIVLLYQKIEALLDETQLVNARKIAEYDEELRKNLYDLIKDDSLKRFKEKLENTNQSRKQLVNYFKNNYLKTIDRERLERNER